MSGEVDRLREHPQKRFADPERKVDLNDCTRELLDEPHRGTDGHRQIAIARQAEVTLILFHFREGSAIPEHVVDGPVTIHVLDGKLDVATESEVHTLSKDQLLFLAPGIVHDVTAHEESRMLLTVHLARPVEESRGR